MEVTHDGGAERDEPDTKHQEGYQWLFNKTFLSDVTLLHGARRIPAHKVILSSSSAGFREIFTGDPKMTEMTLEYETIPQIADMLRHIYGLEPKPYESRNIYDNINLLWLAEKYKIPSLAEITLSHIRGRLEHMVFVEVCPASFAQFIRNIYGHPKFDGKARLLAVELCRQNLKPFIAHSEFQKMLLETPEASLDFLKVVADDMEG